MKQIIEEVKKNRRKTGLILGGIGGLIYLGMGILFLFIPFGPAGGVYNFQLNSIPLLTAGAISEIGLFTKAKISGIFFFISIPIALLTGSILLFFDVSPITFFLILFPLPPHSILVIIGGIICLKRRA